MHQRYFRQPSRIRAARGFAPCLLLIFSAVAWAPWATAATCLVDDSAAGAASGQDWANAYTNLQSALGNGACDEIWVAEGLYLPGSAITSTFVIRPGLRVYGGFAGHETARDQRNPALYASILSGDIDANDSNNDGNAIDETTTDIQGSNAAHVVTLDGSGASPVTAATVLDGFIITGGNAYNTETPPWKITDTFGGGLVCNATGSGSQCSPTLANLVLSGNYAMAGGAMVILATGGSSQATLTDVTFRGNGSWLSAGALYNLGHASPDLDKVTFDGNTTLGNGGAMHNQGHASPQLTNVTFHGNHAEHNGGALFNDGSDGGDASPVLTNVTFSGNSADVHGGAIFNQGRNGGISSPVLSNVILWNDTAGTAGAEIFNDDGGTGTAAASIDHGIVAGGCPAGSSCTHLISDDPLLGTLGDNGGATATMLPGEGSAAIDSGSDASCPIIDQRGLARPQGSHCDLGAVEIFNDTIFRDGFEAQPGPT